MRAVATQLADLIDRCEKHQVSAADLPAEIENLRTSISKTRVDDRVNAHTELLKALRVQLTQITSPPRSEQ